MGRSLLDAFDEDFIKELKASRNHPTAFEKASEKWEREHGFTPFERGYDSFRMKKKRRK